jgi:hypothetical protein
MSILQALSTLMTSASFLPAGSHLMKSNAGILQPLGDLRAAGRRWAIRAGHEVLRDIDQPTFEKVQTCEMLTLYWFSAGESQRNTMFSGMLVQLCEQRRFMLTCT